MKSTELSTIPLTMSTLEIAGLARKRHTDLIRDVKVMLVTLYGKDEIERRIPDHKRNRHSEFVREHAESILSAIAGDDANCRHPGIAGVTWSRDKRGYIRH